ncbi:SRPBCC family protein [Geojedonia litorea]|uniref:SRPBCC family protein n=1 Tax=Geojedonia litorea TaxID=1268269 RepID=A0ABV9MZT5_9FLAO
MANQPTNTLQLGHEYVASDEDVIIQEMVNEMQVQMERMYADKKMLRQIHTKMHGCVKAKFIIEPNLSDDLKVGVFKAAKNYHCWVRFSNSQTNPQPDKKKDIRGIAIKLMNVSGEKILNDKKNEQTHDFLLMSSETFFSKNIKEFRQTLKSSTAKNKAQLLFYFLNPKHWGVFKRLLGSLVKCDNPLNIPYWSTQPYRFGKPDKAVKYFLKPSADNTIINESLTDPYYLRFNLGQTLHNHAAKFDFFVQFQTDASLMPIEDPTVPWDSEFIKLATLEIPAQEFDSNAQMAFGENLSFNSWHALPEHRPLGSFNRARKRVYEAMSKFRHEVNGIPDVEPKDHSDFLTGTHIPELRTITHSVPTKHVNCIKSQVLVNCSKKIAFEFISSNEELPNWLKKVGMIHSALNAEVIEGPYNKVGAKRRVFFDGGHSVLEELMSYNPYANYSYKISEFTNVLKKFSTHAYGELWFDTVDDKTRITWDYTFTHKNMFYGWVLKILLPIVFKKFMQSSLENAKNYIENGD